MRRKAGSPDSLAGDPARRVQAPAQVPAPVAHEVDRYRIALRLLMKERGFTQLHLQELLGWGKSYLSQLLSGKKRLRVDQVVSILGVMEVPPLDFYTSLYTYPEAVAGSRSSERARTRPRRRVFDDFVEAHGLDVAVDVLIEELGRHVGFPIEKYEARLVAVGELVGDD